MNNGYVDQWQALRARYNAKAKQLHAAQRVRYHEVFDDLSAEFQFVTNWDGAAWAEFEAKAARLWRELETNS